MGAAIIDGRAVAQHVRAGVAEDVERFLAAHGRAPGLATIIVGDDPASAIYVAAKHKACEQVGIASFHHALPATAGRDEVLALIDRLNAAPRVSGILCQLPVPDPLDGTEIANRIAPGKDVDGLSVANAGRLALGLGGLCPCTPTGVMQLLAAAGVELAGAHVVVIGRSNLLGKPMAQMLLGADATVTMCHSRTRGLPALCRQADVVVAAAGRPAMVKEDWVAPGAVVIDVGINRTDAGVVGDVDFAGVMRTAAAITPVPGGVGPMTIACLLQNTVRAAELAAAA